MQVERFTLDPQIREHDHSYARSDFSEGGLAIHHTSWVLKVAGILVSIYERLRYRLSDYIP